MCDEKRRPVRHAGRGDEAGGGAYAAGLTEERIRAAGGGRAVKLDSNENPLGPSPLAVEAARRVLERAHRYPPAQDEALCAAIAGRAGVAAERVVVSAGSVDLLDLLLRVLCPGPADAALAFAPCFPAFAFRARRCGVRLVHVPLEDDLRMRPERLGAAADDDTRLVYLANPDNPSGHAVTADALEALAAALPVGALLVVDEAYADFADDPDGLALLPRLERLPRTAVVRTFSKAYGLAGLRVGYGVLPPEVAARVRALQLSFAVSAPAAEAARAALEDEAHRERSVALARLGREFLQAELARLGCAPVPGQGPFVAFRPPVDAAGLCAGLLARGVAVRPLDYAGLPHMLRVSCGTMDENRAFAEALAATLDGLAGAG